jgi:hypothetical protein
MRYLRMFTNAVVAGALGAAYVLLVILQLNPSLHLSPITLVPLAVGIGAYYTISLTALAYLALVARRMLGREGFSPAWISVRVITWLCAVSTAAGALIMWTNVGTFQLVLEPATVRGMTQGAIVLAAAAALLTLAGIAQRYGGARRAWAAVLATVAFSSIVVTIALRDGGSLPPLEPKPLSVMLEAPKAHPSGRVWMIALDAASLDLVTSAAQSGKLPNFGRILDAGAVVHLATIHPTSPEAVWAAVATGKLPQKNGVRSPALYRLSLAPASEAVQLLPDFCFASGLVRFGILDEESRTSASIRSSPLWSILSSVGTSVALLNWPLTYPAPAVLGYVVSDRFARPAQAPAATDGSPLLYPPDAEAEAARALDEWRDERPTPPPGAADISDRHRMASRVDQLYDRIFLSLRRDRPAQVSIVRYQSLDQIGHYFLRYARPSGFGDVSDEERRLFGDVLVAHYALVDAAIGRAIAALGPADLLLVVSGYGMEPLGLGKRVLERLIGDPDISGSHEGAPDGFLMAYGEPVAKTAQVGRASVVDVLPTLLYFLGLPVGRDMDGYVRTDLFSRSFTADQPITYIPTYDR